MAKCNLGLPKFAKSKETLLLEVAYQNDIGFFDSGSLIRKEFILADTTINAEYYTGVLDRLLKQIAHVHPHFHVSNNWFLFHNNLLVHNTTSIRQFLAKETLPPFVTFFVSKIKIKRCSVR